MREVYNKAILDTLSEYVEQSNGKPVKPYEESRAFEYICDSLSLIFNKTDITESELAKEIYQNSKLFIAPYVLRNLAFNHKCTVNI